MVEWLDQNVGPNLATYIGAFLGFVGLVYGGSKVYKNSVRKNSIDIKGGDNSINIQAGRDVKVNKVTKKDAQ
ncbi:MULTISPECIES: hypothetical protein [Vibrio]|uniref:hypothetical protein n=1 Tax=Vibrio TaxID=662 RepID=UPI000C858684|nr:MULTISPECIES: hypothetical protein [Vibrio]PML42331.1 hypothetical protein BCT76_22335 [Vibrio tasmaniensis]PTP79017.1 hypothetical protein CWO00_07260 [Vibrio splendidus]